MIGISNDSAIQDFTAGIDRLEIVYKEKYPDGEISFIEYLRSLQNSEQYKRTMRDMHKRNRLFVETVKMAGKDMARLKEELVFNIICGELEEEYWA